ncbi:MAG: hypothetical protein LBG89_01210 [Rickettsiales bacterium]|jgi:hypothetical protein|nr:hypothetical protein [Rickettsiales bacterium]
MKSIKTEDQLLAAYKAWRASDMSGKTMENDEYSAQLGGEFDFKLSPDLDSDLLSGRIPDAEDSGFLFLNGLVRNSLDGLGKKKQADFIDKVYGGIDMKKIGGGFGNMEILARAFNKYIRVNQYVGAKAQLVNKEFFDIDRERPVNFSPMVSDEKYGGYEFRKTAVLEDLKRKAAADEKKIKDSSMPAPRAFPPAAAPKKKSGADREAFKKDVAAEKIVASALRALAEFKSVVDKKVALAYKLYDIHQEFQKDFGKLREMARGYKGKFTYGYPIAAQKLEDEFLSAGIGNVADYEVPENPNGFFAGKYEKDFYNKFADLAQRIKDKVLAAEKRGALAGATDPMMPEFSNDERAVIGLAERNVNTYVSAAFFGENLDDYKNNSRIDVNVGDYERYMDMELNYYNSGDVAYRLGEKAQYLTDQVSQAEKSLATLRTRIAEKRAEIDAADLEAARHAARVEEFKNEIAVFDPDKFALGKSETTKNYLEKASKRLKNKAAWDSSPSGVVLLDRKLAEEKKAAAENKAARLALHKSRSEL